MSEQEGQQSQKRGKKGQQSQQGGGDTPLKTEQGQTSIQDGVVAKVAGIAAQEIEGIRMGGGGSQAAGGFIGNLTGGGDGGRTRGVAVEVGEDEAAVDLSMTTEYGKSIPQLSEAVRRNVVNRIENLVGLSVTEVNITVSNIFFPQEEQGQQQLEGEQERRVS